PEGKPHKVTTKNAAVLALAVTACFVAVVSACTVIYVVNPGGDNVTSVLTVLLGSLGSTIAVLATLAKVQDVDRKVEYLANGGMDAKVRAGVADVMRDDMLDPTAAGMIE